MLQLLKIGKCLSFNKPQLPDVAGPVLFSAYSNRLYGAATITDQLDVIYGKAYSLCFAAHTHTVYTNSYSICWTVREKAYTTC